MNNGQWGYKSRLIITWNSFNYGCHSNHGIGSWQLQLIWIRIFIENKTRQLQSDNYCY